MKKTNAIGKQTQQTFSTNFQKNPTLADSGFSLEFQYQGGVKAIVFGVFEDLKFKISKGYKQS